MTPIAYFKLQAKNLFRDYKTQYAYQTDVDGTEHYDYKPKYFDVNGLVVDFDLDEKKFTLMNAQHIIAMLAGFYKWTDMLKASETQLKLAKLLFDNAHKISIDEWDQYIGDAEDMNITIFDDEAKLGIFEGVFANSEEHQSMFADYRLDPKSYHKIERGKPQQILNPIPDVQITSLPLNKEDRAEFIETANSVFETIMAMMEPRNPDQTRKLWDAEDYIDHGLLAESMLPISKSYALSLIESFLVGHVAQLAAQADKMAA